MGEDGHTASLFPGAEGLAAALEPEGADLLAAIDPPFAHHARITMTVAALLHSRQIYLLLSGPGKRRVLEQAAGNADPIVHPVAAVLGQRRAPVAVYWSESDE
jgi:6-phosphogluconolactonase